MHGGMRALVIILLVLLLFWPYIKIIQKAGYSGWWVLVVFVPLLNFVMLWVFAFSDWPALREQK